jgi:hypothetical protein
MLKPAQAAAWDVNAESASLLSGSPVSRVPGGAFLTIGTLHLGDHARPSFGLKPRSPKNRGCITMVLTISHLSFFHERIPAVLAAFEWHSSFRKGQN